MQILAHARAYRLYQRDFLEAQGGRVGHTTRLANTIEDVGSKYTSVSDIHIGILSIDMHGNINIKI